jgi:phage-related protein
MADVEELVVRARPAGIDETTQGLEEMEGRFEETAAGMEETTGLFADLQNRWTGAFGALTAGLAIATAGLLSQVPVIGEVVSGLTAVVESLANRLDQVLRPVLEPISALFFNVADAIMSVEGPLGDLLDAALVFATTSGTIVAAITAVSTAMGLLSAATLPISGTVLALVAAFAALVAIWTTDFLGIRTAVMAVIDGVVSAVEGLLDDVEPIINSVISALGDLTAWTLGSIEGALNTLSDLLGGAADIAGDVWDFLTDIGAWALGGIETALNTLDSLLQDPLGTIEGILAGLADLAGKTVDAFVDIILTITDPISEAIGDIPGFSGQAPGGFGVQGGTQSPTVGGGITINPSLNVDGRTLNETQTRYGADTIFRRGGGP